MLLNEYNTNNKKHKLTCLPKGQTSFFCFLFFYLIEIHSMQGWTAATRHGVTRKRSTKRLNQTGNLFRKNLQLKDIC